MMCNISDAEGCYGSDPFFVTFVLKEPCPCSGLAAMASPVDFVTKVTQQLNLKIVADNTNIAIQLVDFILTL